MAKKTKQEQLFPDPQVLDFQFEDQVLNPMLEAGWVEMTIPGKRLTGAFGKNTLADAQNHLDQKSRRRQPEQKDALPRA